MTSRTTSDRMKSVFGVTAIHALLAYAFIAGLRLDFAAPADNSLKLFDLPTQNPPPPVEEPLHSAPEADAPEGAASPPNLTARPTPVVTPPPPVRLDVPPPIVAAPTPGPGADASAGASTIAGPGTGAGGEGAGTGSGRSGSGAGGGGVATRARHLSGRIADTDYPRKAGDDGAEGTVVVHFTVRTDGRTEGCKVIDSSGNAELDEATCRLVERRFRYAPATDAQGRAIPDITGWKEIWWIGSRRRFPLSRRGEGEATNDRAD